MSSTRARGHRCAAWLWTLLLAGMTGGGCVATTGAYQAGVRAERAEDYDQAVVNYTQAAIERPDDVEVRAALQRARVRASEAHHARGRRLHGLARYDEALVELQLAADMNPANADIERLLRDTRIQQRTRVAVERDGRTALESVIARARALAPAGQDLPADVALPDSLVFRDAGSRDVFSSLARFAGISVAFDPQFRSTPVSVDLRGVSLTDALDVLTRSTSTFYKVTAPRTITIVPDTAAKRREYDEEIIRTFYLSNADVKETIDLLRIVVDARRLSPITATNAISLRDTPERVAAAERLITAIDKARAEVVIDVELLEIDRTRFKQYGMQILSPGSDGLAGQVDINQTAGLTLQDLRSLGQGDVFFTNLPGLYYRLLKRDTNTRTLANPQLRTSDGLAAQAKFGEEVPVPQVTFSPIAAGGVNQQPITSYSYRNVGVNIDITPRTHHNDDVSLAVRIEVSSLSPATGFSGLPIFGTRSITTNIRLRDGETNLLAGLIRDNERSAMRGIPGLSDVPLIGRLFANNERESQQTDIVLMLTPRIIRVLDVTEDDLRPFLVGRGAMTGTAPALERSAPASPPEPRQPPQGYVPVERDPSERPPQVPPTRPPAPPVM